MKDLGIKLGDMIIETEGIVHEKNKIYCKISCFQCLKVKILKIE